MEAAATRGLPRRSLQTQDPCGRDAELRASPSAVPPSSSSPRLPGCPSLLGGAGLLRASSPALSPLSLSLQQVWAPGRQTGAGRPCPGFLGSAPLLLGVRPFCCFYLGSGSHSRPLLPQSSLRASPTLPRGPPPSLPRCLGSGSVCGNDVRIGGSKFFLCLGGPSFFFLGDQIVLILLVSKSEAEAGETNAIFPLDSKNHFNFYFYF